MIYLGSDHGGFQLKEKIKAWLKSQKLEFEDIGPQKLDPNDDYPQYAFAVAEKVGLTDDPASSWKKRDKGILICRSAVGVTVAANKVKDVRAVAAYDTKIAEHARTNDDTNVLCLSGDWMNETQAKEILLTWLNTEFSGETRHKRRLDQIHGKESDTCECDGNCDGCC